MTNVATLVIVLMTSCQVSEYRTAARHQSIPPRPPPSRQTLSCFPSIRWRASRRTRWLVPICVDVSSGRLTGHSLKRGSCVDHGRPQAQPERDQDETGRSRVDPEEPRDADCPDTRKREHQHAEEERHGPAQREQPLALDVSTQPDRRDDLQWSCHDRRRANEEHQGEGGYAGHRKVRPPARMPTRP